MPSDVKVFIGKNVSVLKCNITPTEIINLRILKEQNEIANQAALQFLEILSSQESIKKYVFFIFFTIIFSEKYHIFTSKMFLKDSCIKLEKDPRILKEGMQKNVRIIGNSPSTSNVIVQLDSAFNFNYCLILIKIF